MALWLNRQFIPNSISAVIEEGLELERLQKYSYFKGKVGEQDIEKVSDTHLYVKILPALSLSIQSKILKDMSRI